MVYALFRRASRRGRELALYVNTTNPSTLLKLYHCRILALTDAVDVYARSQRFGSDGPPSVQDIDDPNEDAETEDGRTYPRDDGPDENCMGRRPGGWHRGSAGRYCSF